MYQKRQGTRSTKPVPIDPDTTEEAPNLTNNNHIHHVYMTITNLYGKLYSDETGHFPIMPNCGNCYVVIFYEVDGNYIKAYPIKYHHRSHLIKAYNDMYAFLRVRGYQPKLYKMDNKTSKDVENFIEEHKAKVQYTPVDINRNNISEQCCCTRKNYFTAVRAGAPPFFLYSKLV